MSKQYRVPRWYAITGLLLAALWISGCSGIQLPGQEPTATPRPWARFHAQDVIDSFQAVGLSLQNLRTEMQAGSGAPLTFTERLTFEIPRIAPAGGQIVVFSTPEDLQTWTDWVAQLRNDPNTRRTVVYVYTNQNALIWMSASLTNQEAAAYRDTFLALQ